jgi:hypothetical protein
VRNGTTFGGTAFFLGFVGPGANAGFFVVDEAVGACDHVEFAVDAVVEFVADVGLFVGEVPVLAGAVLTRLGCFCNFKSRENGMNRKRNTSS